MPLTGNPSIADILAAITDMRTSLTSQITDTQNKITESQEKQEVRNKDVQNHLKVHDRKFDQMYKRDTKRNLVIFGLDEALGKTMQIMREKVLDLLTNKLMIKDVRVFDIHDIRVVGGKKNLLVVTLCSPHLVRMALSNSMKLKGSKISVDFDLSPEERAEKKQLLAFKKEFKGQGKDCKLRKNTLIIGNETFTLQQLITNSKASGAPNASQSQDNVLMAPLDEDYEMSDLIKKRTPPGREEARNTKKFALNAPKILADTPNSKFTSEKSKDTNT